MSLMEKIFGDLNTKEIKKIEKIVDQIESYDEAMTDLSDADLRAKTDEFKQRLADGSDTLDSLLPEAFAAAREGALRSVGMKPYREQLIGGVVLHQGRIAEMKTGEGKTLVATLPVYLNALEGKGVHVITVNDYLAKRDSEWMGKVYSFMGLTVGCVIHGISNETRRAAYQADITYGTNNEFGFDYLRDNMVQYEEQESQRPLNFAIVDEVDSILVDEARTPLIISGQGTDSSDLYKKADKFICTLNAETDYDMDEKDQQVALTEEGVDKAEKFFNLENFSDPTNMEINHNIQQALKAHTLMERDIDYIVKDGEIIIVDEFTGRLMPGRRYSNGLHQAIEAKEHLTVRSESKTLATITIQNYFRMYQKLSGMTGTAKTEEDEFREIYNMDVVVIPTHKPVIREDKPDAVYQNERAKWNAVADRVAEVYNNGEGQPVLVGTISIEKSQVAHELLKQRGIPHDVLNAKNHEREAEIVAQAGRKGHVTIATNMAGRGTDILLGGNPDFLARKEMRKHEYTDEEINFATGFAKSDDERMNQARADYQKFLAEYKVGTDAEHDEVVALGGLCILGTERHESRRIDNQLRGRAGRQGDPGMTQFFLAMDDELMRRFGGERMQDLVQKAGLPEDEPIERKMLTKSIENAQKKVEGRNFGIRRYVLQYDDIMNKQREIIYSERKKVLGNANLRQDILDMCHAVIEQIITPITLGSKYPEEWDFDEMNRDLHRFMDLYKGKDEYDTDELVDMTAESLIQSVCDEFDAIYAKKEEEIGANVMRQLEQRILLMVVDRHWMDHIDIMDDLREGIGLRAIGQQDPVAAYAKEGFDMFEEMNHEIQVETVQYCYHVSLNTNTERKNEYVIEHERKEEYQDPEAAQAQAQARAQAQAQPQPKQGGELSRTARRKAERAANASGAPAAPKVPPRDAKADTVRRDQPKIGRNDPCPCGSGKKYKNCCMKKDMARELHTGDEDK